MAQFDFGNLESPLSGTVFINGNLEPWRDALHSSHKGGSRPSYAVEGMLWVDDTTNPWILNMFDGSNDIALGSFDTTTNTFTPSGVSQAAEDISFDNTDSGLTATNVQDAIDEAVGDFSDFEGRVVGFATAAQGDLADSAVQPGDAFSAPFSHYQDQKAQGTDGGTFTQSAWQTRVLNTSLSTGISGSSLSSNQISLPAGTYYVEAIAPGFICGRHKARLYNVTDSAVLLAGTSEISGTGDAITSFSKVSGRFTLSGTKTIALEHYCLSTRSTDGFGASTNVPSTVEVYSDIKIWKVA